MSVVKGKYHLNITLLFYVVLVGTFVTMISTGLQLFLDYKKNINYLDVLTAQVKVSYTESITEAAWNIDTVQIQALLDGLVAIPEITYASVIYREQTIAESGNAKAENAIKNIQTLNYKSFDNEGINIGDFIFHTSRKPAIDSLINNFFVALLFNFIRTFLIAGFILFIVDYLITRHLRKITDSLKTIDSFESLDKRIELDGPRSKPNELDVVVDTINGFNNKLYGLWGNYRISEKNLKEKQAAVIQKDKMNTLGVMVAGITHEINNPNNLIKINADIIQSSWKEILPILDAHFRNNPNKNLQNIPYDEMKGFLSSAMEDTAIASQRIEAIISGLSTFIRGEENLEMSQCSLQCIIVETIKMLDPQIKQKNIRVEFNEDNNIKSIEAYSPLINQIFVNLILNAIEACDSKFNKTSEQCDVIINISEQADSVNVTVRDFGVGISPEYIDKIFDLFQSSKFSTGGTGIGLSIVYSLVELHGGDISVKSSVGEGSTFTVKLPLEQKIPIKGDDLFTESRAN